MKEYANTLLTKSPSRIKKSPALFRNVALIVGLVALAGMIWGIGAETILKNIEDVGWNFVWIILVWMGVYLLNAISWRFIIRDETTQDSGLSFWHILKYTISGYAINYATPMGLAGGEPYRIMELRRYIGTEKATSSVILYAMMHVVSHFFFWLFAVVLILSFVPVSNWIFILMTSVFVVCSVLIYIFFRGYRKGMVVKFFRILEHIPYIRRLVLRMSDEKRQRLHVIDQQIKHLHAERPGPFYLSLGIEFVSRLLSCVEIYIIIRLLGGDISYIQSVIVVALTSLFANILFFSPMQLGTREGGYFLALKVLSLPAGMGISVSLITRIREAFWIALGMLIMKIDLKGDDK